MTDAERRFPIVSVAGEVAETIQAFIVVSMTSLLAFHIPLGFPTVQFECTVLPAGLLVAGLAGWLINRAIAAIPPEHRKDVTPDQAWFLLIPIFNIVWNFILLPKVCDSFQSYFEANSRPQPGDYGRGLSLAFAICAAMSIVPCLNCLTLLPTLVLLILVLVKFSSLKDLIKNGGGGAFPM